MRTTRARQAALLLGVGLGAFLEGIVLHPVAGLFYMAAWGLTALGVLMLWLCLRGPGPLPSGREFAGHLLVGWGVFDIVEYLARHDLSDDWLIFAVGAGCALLGLALIVSREEPMLERRSGMDRRSALSAR
jgi:uncharacterized membrane protein